MFSTRQENSHLYLAETTNSSWLCTWVEPLKCQLEVKDTKALNPQQPVLSKNKTGNRTNCAAQWLDIEDDESRACLCTCGVNYYHRWSNNFVPIGMAKELLTTGVPKQLRELTRHSNSINRQTKERHLQRCMYNHETNRAWTLTTTATATPQRKWKSKSQHWNTEQTQQE